MRDVRLGDDIDDFCVRCKRVMNHAVVSVISAAPAKVRCRTCHSDHDFRHEQAPPPKVDARKAALFQEVLKKVNPDAAIVDADVVEVPDEIEPDAEVLADVDVDGPEMALVEEAPPVEKAPKPKAKAKGRGKK
jgi:acetone carboxylase gamma subunit